MPKHKKRYSVSLCYINPKKPEKGMRWYIWVECWSGWKKTMLETFMSKAMDPELRARLVKASKRKGVPAPILERMEKEVL